MSETTTFAVTAVYNPESRTLMSVNDQTIFGVVDISGEETVDEIVSTLNAGGSYLLPVIQSSRDEKEAEFSCDCCVAGCEPIRSDAKLIWVGCVRDGYGQMTNAMVTSVLDEAQDWLTALPEYYGADETRAEDIQVRFLQRWVVRS